MNNSNLINCPFDSNGNRKAFLLPFKVTSQNLHAYRSSGWLTTADENKNPPINKWCIIDPEVETIVKLKGNKFAEQIIDPIVDILIETTSLVKDKQKDLQLQLDEAKKEEEYIRELLNNDTSLKAISSRRDARKKREAIEKEILEMSS